jgi:hypothetical protein
MRAKIDRIQTRHPDPAKSMPRIERDVYDAFRTAILAVAPPKGDGVPFQDLPRLVKGQIPAGINQRIGSVGWYVTTVKLDLEARGEIERIPGSRPQRVRRRA